MNGSISIAIIFSVIAAATSVYTMWNSHKKNQAEEASKALATETSLIKLDVKMDNVLDSTGSILGKQEQQALKLEHLSGEIIKSNERIETLFKYKDDHESRLKRLESK